MINVLAINGWLIDPAAGWFCAKALAGLPAMPGTDRGVRKSAAKNLWKVRAVARGKGCEYAFSSLPAATQSYLIGLAHDLVASSEAPIATAKLQPSEDDKKLQGKRHEHAVKLGGQIRRPVKEAALNDLQRKYRDAALLLCRVIEEPIATWGCSRKRACRDLACRLVDGTAHPDLILAAEVTYLKKRDGKRLGGVEPQTLRLERLMAFFERGRLAGDVSLYMTPGRTEYAPHNPIHTAAFLRFYCQPSRPPVAEAYREMGKFLSANGHDVPSYQTVWRIERDLPITVKYRGRVTGSEWRNLKPFIDRDVSMFSVNDIWVGDGHSFKAKVQHPQSGQPFIFEVTFIIDWVSRKIVGWSISLAESTVAVSDAFRHAQMQTRARPLVYYSDNGSGQTGKLIDCPISGTLSRQCIAHETGIPGNPQARGIIETLWRTTLIPLARTYPTCIWRGADKNSTTKMLKALRRKDQGGVRIPTFDQLVSDIRRVVAQYNFEHNHSELGGKTPEQEYQAKLDKSSIVFAPTDDEIQALWMPEVVRKTSRGLVNLFGKPYFLPELVNLLPEKAKVRARYDLHDPSCVSLLTLDGVYLGKATLNGNSRPAFPVSRMDQLKAARVARIVRRGEKIIAVAQAELGAVLEQTPAVPMPLPQPVYMPLPVATTSDEAITLSHEEMVKKYYAVKTQAESEPDKAESLATDVP